MLATNKTPLPDQQNSSKQFQFNLIKVVYEVKEEKQNSIPQVYTIPEVAEILKCKIKTVEGDVGAKKIIDMNKDKILFFETNDISVTKDFNTKDSFNI